MWSILFFLHYAYKRLLLSCFGFIWINMLKKYLKFNHIGVFMQGFDAHSTQIYNLSQKLGKI